MSYHTMRVLRLDSSDEKNRESDSLRNNAVFGALLWSDFQAGDRVLVSNPKHTILIPTDVIETSDGKFLKDLVTEKMYSYDDLVECGLTMCSTASYRSKV